MFYDMTTTQDFPYITNGNNTASELTSTAFPSSVDTAEAGKLQLRIRESKFPKGAYEFTISGSISSTSLANYVLGRYSLDGGTTWYDFSVKVDDVNADKMFHQVISMTDFLGQTFDYIAQFKKTAGTDTVNISSSNIIMRRVG